MKNKLALAAAVFLVAGSVQAGPAVSVWFGSGGCYQPAPMRPVCAYPPRYYQPVYYAQPVVYYNPVPACSVTTTRFSNVPGFINGGQGVIQVPQPVYPVQPVVVYPQNNFRWR